MGEKHLKESEQITEATKIRTNDPKVLELWVKAGGRCEIRRSCSKMQRYYTGSRGSRTHDHHHASLQYAAVCQEQPERIIPAWIKRDL